MRTEGHRSQARSFVFALLLVVAVIALGGCGSKSTSVAAPATSGSGAASATASASAPASAPAQPLPARKKPPVAQVPADQGKAPADQGTSVGSASIAYAKKLGGGSHKGETLYLVVGATAGSETDAQATLKAALPKFDTALYMVVQRSDNFDGLNPGSWLLIEAYRDQAQANEGAKWDKRGFADCYVKRVVVKTSDPIPVIED